MNSKIKSVLKLATAVALSFGISPLCVASSPSAILPQSHSDAMQTLKFAWVDQKQGRELLKLSPVAPDGDNVFSLDLIFHTDKEEGKLGIASLIHYNSKKIEIAGISNVADADIQPDPSNLNTRPDKPKPGQSIKVAGVSVATDTDTSLLLTWQAREGIPSLSVATEEQPARLATIKFKWKEDVAGSSYIGITPARFGSVHGFSGEGIMVQGPLLASVTARPVHIDLTASSRIPLVVECSLSRLIEEAETTCTLKKTVKEDDSGAKKLVSTIYPKIDVTSISIPGGEASASRTFHLAPSTKDNGRSFEIALSSATAGGMSFKVGNAATVSLGSPGFVVSKKEISIEEGDTAELEVHLATPPDGNVVVDIRPDPNIATVVPASLTFTADNWNEKQGVSVSSTDDDIVEDHKRLRVIFSLNSDKTDAMRYDNARGVDVSTTFIENDNAKVVLTVQPNERLQVGTRQIVVTAALEGNGVFAANKYIQLRVKETGSAEEGIDYEPINLSKLTIPAREASASKTFTVTVLDGATGTVAIEAEVFASTDEFPDTHFTIGDSEFDFDVTGDGRFNGLDGRVLVRYLLGLNVKNVIPLIGEMKHTELVERIERGGGALNVSGLNDNRTNGVLILRYSFGLRENDLVDGFGPSIDPDVVAANIERFLP